MKMELKARYQTMERGGRRPRGLPGQRRSDRGGGAAPRPEVREPAAVDDEDEIDEPAVDERSLAEEPAGGRSSPGSIEVKALSR